jgi:hypothetical protein
MFWKIIPALPEHIPSIRYDASDILDLCLGIRYGIPGWMPIGWPTCPGRTILIEMPCGGKR